MRILTSRTTRGTAYRTVHVTKARATRASASTESAARADGCEPVKVKASKRHGSCAAHFRVPGMREPVCIAPATDENGRAVAPEWSDADTVLAFALAYGHAERDELRALAERDAIARHAEHTPDMRINGREYRGAPDCWHCEREYRDNAARTLTEQERGVSQAA